MPLLFIAVAFFYGDFIMDYDKPFKSFKELALCLQNEHGLMVDDVNQAAYILQFLPYYDLVNGYKEILMTNDHFKLPLKISDLAFFHSLDHNFQGSLISFSISIEDYFKNILAYVIAKSFSVSEGDYLDESHYIRRKPLGAGKTITRHAILGNLKAIAADTHDNPTFYYRKNHNHIPPWILLKNTSFSLSTNLFVLLPSKQKEEVVDFMIPGGAPWDVRYQILLYSLTMIRKCRNVIAHNLKFTSFDSSRYMNNLDQKALRKLISPILLTDEEIKYSTYLSGIYGYIVLSLSIIPKGITHVLLVNRLHGAMTMDGIFSGSNLSDSLGKIKEIYFSGVHLPQDVESRLNSYFVKMYEN